MKEFLDSFIDEARELVNGLESRLMHLEANPNDRPSIDEVFRVMHTLKGTSAMFGFNNIELVTHHLETIYDQIRDGEKYLTKSIIDITLDTIDIINNILDKQNVLDENEISELSDLNNRILSAGGLEQKEAIRTVKKKVPKPQIDPETRFFYILYCPSEDIYTRGINPLIIFYELNEIGKYRAIPLLDKTPDIHDFNPDKFFLYWDIFLVTQSNKEQVEDVFLFFDESDYFVHELDINQLDENAFRLEFSRITNRNIKEGEIFKLYESIEGTNLEKLKKDDINELKAQSIIKEQHHNETGKRRQNQRHQVSSIRVSAEKLDDLIINVSEFVTLYSQISLLSKDNKDIQLNKSIQSLGKLSKKLRDNALELRLVPVNEISLKMHRLVRDLSSKLNKDIHFITEGMDTELDKTIIENLEDPLMHIIRNSIDHGIEDKETRLKLNKPETGVIRLTAFYSGAYVFIQIQDDGKGIDEELIKTKAVEKGLLNKNIALSKREIYDILFEAGFSTAESVSKISGRGVGMDVVKTKINELRGEIEIDSELGLGTSVTIKLPLTLSIIDTLKVKINRQLYLIPLSTVETCINVKYQTYLHKTQKQFEYEEELLPLIILREEFEINQNIPENGKMVIIHQYEKRYCLLVDQVLGDHQAVVKPLGDLHKSHNYFSGVSVMGDGSLALILDTGKLLTSNRELYNIKQI